VLFLRQETNRNVLIVEPAGALFEEDLFDLGQCIGEYIDEREAIPSLVLHATRFHGWKDLSALMHHLRLVRDHHRLIPKVAIVSDGAAMSMVPKLANQFVVTKLQHFSEQRLEEAKSWAADGTHAASTHHVGAVERFDDLPDDVLGFRVFGTLTDDELESYIIPTTEKRVTGPIKLLVQLGPEFEAHSTGAAWNDAKVGLRHLSDFTRCAIVTDAAGFKEAARVFSPLMNGKVRVFASDDLSVAKDWIKA
jgi:hypothetical protein